MNDLNTILLNDEIVELENETSLVVLLFLNGRFTIELDGAFIFSSKTWASFEKKVTEMIGTLNLTLVV